MGRRSRTASSAITTLFSACGITFFVVEADGSTRVTYNAVVNVIAPSSTPGAFASATGQSRTGFINP